jgi:hypothetical protein
VIEDDGGLVVARIVIERKMMPDGKDRVDAQFTDGTDDESADLPAAVEFLGMLAMTMDTVLHGGIYDDDEDDDT